MTARPGEVIRSILFYAAFYGGSVCFVLAGLAVMALGTGPLRRVASGWSHYHRACVRGLLGIKVRTRGVIPSGQLLVAIKHESFFEAIDLPCLLPDPAVFAKAELLRLPLWGKAASDYGLIPVERAEGASALRRMLSGARARLAEGRPLVIFPEGTRVPHGRAPDLRAGFAGLYKMLGVPVVPLAIDSGTLYHRRWKRPGTITIRVGETIPPGLPRAEIEARVHAEINALNESS